MKLICLSINQNFVFFVLARVNFSAMLENQVVANESKDNNNRSVIVERKFHETFLTSRYPGASGDIAMFVVTYYYVTYKTSNNILESDYFANKLSKRLMNI